MRFARSIEGDLEVAGRPRNSRSVIPAKAGIQRLQSHAAIKPWMFGFAEVQRSPLSRE
ncbi:hypothetical protein bcgnr5380_63960 [Bacillus cereus]